MKRGGQEKRIAPIAILISLLPVLLQAQTPQSGFSFLKIGASARGIGMGGAYTALTQDSTAIYWNPAGLTSVNKTEVSAMHSSWLLDASFDTLALAVPGISKGVLGFGLTQLSHPSQEGRGADGARAENFKARDFSAALAYSGRWAFRSQFGLGLKFIESRIAQDKAQAFALEGGARHRLTSFPLSFGLAFSNLGAGIRFLDEETRLPLAVSAGMACESIAGFFLALDIQRRVYDGKTTIGLGTEYALLGGFALRGGYSLGSQAGPPNKSALSGLAAGFGLKILNYSLDYALRPLGDLGDTHRLSLGARF